MKIIFTQIWPLIALTMVVSCSPAEKEKSKAPEQITQPGQPVEKQSTPFEGKYSSKIKEDLFFFLRENAVNVDHNTFVMTEDIDLVGDQFVYRVKYIDKGLAMKIGFSSNETFKVHASFGIGDQQKGDEDGNEMIIKGSLMLVNDNRSGTEIESESLTVAIAADIETSYLQKTPYGYGESNRVNDGYEYEAEMIVSLNQPRIYTKETLYLKARITQLDASDLSPLDQEELSYFRNEIFARHGHTFKTDKMIDYFDSKGWYVPLFEDATPYLNETEKSNTLFIKSLES
ncbi:YARHG domain-containing protein [Imperialibacter sp.]|uniref:YARHG domain-containing protein n=1 Tax=Imperialibacter sp. TaxID=2038411 RepID=UPI0032ED68B8